MENNEKDFKIEVDMTSYISDEAKDIRSKIRSCQSQMDYLAYKYDLYKKKQTELVKEYNKILGVEEHDKSVQ